MRFVSVIRAGTSASIAFWQRFEAEDASNGGFVRERDSEQLTGVGSGKGKWGRRVVVDAF